MSDCSSARMRSIISNYSAVERLYRAIQYLLCIVPNRFQQTMMFMRRCSSRHGSVIKPAQLCLTKDIGRLYEGHVGSG